MISPHSDSLNYLKIVRRNNRTASGKDKAFEFSETIECDKGSDVFIDSLPSFLRALSMLLLAAFVVVDEM